MNDRRPSVFVETHGCAYNAADGETMAGVLAAGGFAMAARAADADAVVVNTCTVKDRTLLDLRKRLRALAALPRAPVVVLAGCVPRVAHYAREFAGYAMVGPDNLDAVAGVVDAALSGVGFHALRRGSLARLGLPRLRRSRTVEIVPIGQGCLGSCTFCQTLLARGRHVSYGAEEIAARIGRGVAEGARVVWLTSQDCGAWGLDAGSNLPALLHRLAEVPEDFRVRVGMANPDLLLPCLDAFAGALAADPRFFRFVHLPVQAGSDAVLTAMGRPYTADDFRRIVARLRELVPGITIATDVIVGYPTETDTDFEATMQLMRDVRPEVINRSRYSPRPGTRAARLLPLDGGVVAARSTELDRQYRGQVAAELAAWKGWRGEAVIEDRSPEGRVLARNPSYKAIVLPAAEAGDGGFVNVEITGHEGFHLTARVR